MYKIGKVIIADPKPGTVHQMVLPRQAMINERMMVAAGRELWVFFGFDPDGSKDMAPRHLITFRTMQAVGMPGNLSGELTYITTVLQARAVLAAGGAPMPEELHVFEWVADEAGAAALKPPAGTVHQ